MDNKNKVFSEKRQFIPIENIYYMLAYAFDCLKEDGEIQTNGENFNNFQSIMAAILSECIEKQIKRGLARSYKDIVDDIPTLRGRLDIYGAIRNKVKCRRLRFTVDRPP